MADGRAIPLRLVIFDCDGVLIDSEPVVNQVVAEELTRLGWPMTPEEACARFLGLDLTAMVALIGSVLGRPLPMTWQSAMQARIVSALQVDAPMVPGAREALEAVTTLGLPWRVASNSSHQEMLAKFGRNGMCGRSPAGCTATRRATRQAGAGPVSGGRGSEALRRATAW